MKDKLREAARNIQGKLGRCLYRRKDVDEMQQISGMLCEAADRIAALEGLVEDMYFDLLAEMPESMLEDRRSQMRELGIEVDYE